jgi:23S rRNA pseudouridine955/2504/2580 synthase
MSYEEVDVSEQQHPPARSAVRHLEVPEAQDGQRLDNFLQRVLAEVPRSRLYRIIRKGEVRVNGRRAGPETRLHARDRVRIPPVQVLPRSDPARPTVDALEAVRQAIVYEDERVLVLNKPAGMAVHGGSGVSSIPPRCARCMRC